MARVPERLVLAAGDQKEIESLLASRTCEARVHERALILHLKAEAPRTDYAVSCRANVSERTVSRVLARYREGGLGLALGDRPRAGRPKTVSDADTLWVVALACSKPKDVGCRIKRELWYPALFCDHVREVAEEQGHARMATACDETILRVLEEARIQPFRLRYYCSRKDPDFEAKKRGLLAVYRELSACFDDDGNRVRQPVARDGRVVHVLSYDEKPGIQSLELVADDRMPDPARAAADAEAMRAAGAKGAPMSAAVCRDYEYRRRGTVSLLCAIDLLDGVAHHSVRLTHKSSDYVDFLGKLDSFYPRGHVIRIILDNHSVHTSRETQLYLNTVPGRFEFVFTPKHASWCNLVEGFFSTMTKQILEGIRCRDRDELRERIDGWFEQFNAGEHRPRRWTWGIGEDADADLEGIDVADVVFHVVNGACCRPRDWDLRAARPRPVPGTRASRTKKSQTSGPGWEQLQLPLVWDEPKSLEKEAA